MSYSDYGSYNWKKAAGGWIYAPELEDRSLYGGKASNELHEQTGLKFDAVLLSQETVANNPDMPWYLTHTHHSVIGHMQGFAVCSYKGRPGIIWRGDEIDNISYDDVDPTIWEKGVSIPKENFVPKTISLEREDCVVRVLIDKSFNFWSVAYVNNRGDEEMGICGYGLGEHWWLDEEGNVTYEPGPNEPIWPREQACFDKCIKLLWP